jgi:uncharacterized membrane protein
MHMIQFIFAMVLFVGGLVLMGYSFDVQGLEAAMFVAGLLVLCASVALAVEFGRREHRRRAR